MFNIGASELLVIVIVAILVIGPKEMPRALRTAGRWIGKMRRMSAHFRSGIDTMIREAELEDAEEDWRERIARISAEPSGSDLASEIAPLPTEHGHGMDCTGTHGYDARDKPAIDCAKQRTLVEEGGALDAGGDDQPSLPLDPAAPEKKG